MRRHDRPAIDDRLFLISGIVGLITTFRMRRAAGFWWSLVSAILGIAVGIVLLLWPLSGVLLAYLDSHRVFRDRRRCLDHVRARAQALAVGAMGLDAGERHHRPDLGHYHFRRPAGTAAWAIGLLVGINMVFGGSALIAMALHAREVDPRSAVPAH